MHNLLMERTDQGRGIASGCRPAHAPADDGCFHHESLFYSDEDEFMRAALDFLYEGIERDERALVAVGAPRIELLREALGPDAEQVRFTDMRVLGANPARIIPAWHAFLQENDRPGAGARGIGEPVWPGRGAAELAECQRHEALLNTAFDGGEGWRLLCPYDLENLEEPVIEAARRSHPHISCAGRREPSAAYDAPFDLLAGALPEPPPGSQEMSFTGSELVLVRDTVRAATSAAELAEERGEDLLLAVSELACNSVLHGGGRGRLRIWTDQDTLMCEVSDAGHISDPLAGRVRPLPGQLGGRGLWLANQVCDLAQIRSSALGGSSVRLHMRLP